MPIWCKKLLLALAFAVMPLQGIAATLTVLLCHGDAHAHAMHVTGSHEHGAPDAEHHNEHQHAGSQDEGSTGNASYDLCCNLAASVPPAAVIPAALPDFSVQAFAPAPLHDLFIPDRPQRPPLV